MKFSFVITYRDRDPEAVRNNIHSLLGQTVQDFEICFVDYGSQEKNRQAIVTLLEGQPKVRYRYVHTRGHLWCRSHANNLGVALAQGEFVVMVDVDLIYPPFFLERITPYLAADKQLLYYCYFAPQSFTAYETLDWEQPLSFRQASPTLTETGLVIQPRQAFQDVGYFDEYYKVWGVEDAEFNERVQQAGYQPQKIPLEELFTLHQWHPSNARRDAMPQNWLTFMRKRKQQTTQLADRRYLPAYSHPRPLTAIAENNAQAPDISLSFTLPLSQAYNHFYKAFTQLRAGEVLYVKQDFGEIILDENSSKIARLAAFLNKQLARRGVAYRIVEPRTYEQGEILDFYAVRDFIYYFLVTFESSFEDYYLDIQPPHTLRLYLRK